MKDHRPRRYSRVGLASLVSLALLLLTTGIVMAKESANWVTIMGPGLTGAATATDPDQLASVGPRSIADYRNPLGPTIASTGGHMPYSRVSYTSLLQREQLSAPPDAGLRYELTEYFQDGLGQVSTLRFHYHPSITGGPGYIFSAGFLEDGFADSTGQWYPVSPTAERAIQKILNREGIPSGTSSSLVLAAIPTIAVLLGASRLARRRRRPVPA